MIRHRSLSRRLTFASVAFCLCIGIGALFLPPLPLPVSDRGEWRGMIVSEPEIGAESWKATVRLEDGTRAKVRFQSFPVYAYGDRISFVCKLEAPEPIEGFRYDRYLQSQGIAVVCWRPNKVRVEETASFSVIGSVLALKQFLVQRLTAAVPAPVSFFLAGILFGGSSGLGEETRDAFAQTGLAHILAASGFNVSLFSALFYGWAAEQWGRRRGMPAAVVLLLAYVVMAGGGASIVRAAFMGLLNLLGVALRRRADPAALVAFSAAVLTAWRPLAFAYDPGFQLSFLAFAGLVWLAPHWEDRFTFLPEAFGIRASFTASLAACAVTAPVLAWHFNQLSLAAPLANLFVLPFVIPLMGLAALTLVAALIHPILGTMLGLPAWGLAAALLQFIGGFGGWLGGLPSPPRFITLLVGFLIPVVSVWITKRASGSSSSALRLR